LILHLPGQICQLLWFLGDIGNSLFFNRQPSSGPIFPPARALTVPKCVTFGDNLRQSATDHIPDWMMDFTPEFLAEAGSIVSITGSPITEEPQNGKA
jgi:hypothetical protein